jgi:predicted  nucleic acid-binding Zn-ribbon protein
MNYPTEWWIRDKINEATRGFAKSYEVDALGSNVGRLEHSLREARAEADGLRDELRQLQESHLKLQDAVIELMQPLTKSGEHV